MEIFIYLINFFNSNSQKSQGLTKPNSAHFINHSPFSSPMRRWSNGYAAMRRR